MTKTSQNRTYEAIKRAVWTQLAKAPPESAALDRPREQMVWTHRYRRIKQHYTARHTRLCTYLNISFAGGEKAACDVSGEETRTIPWLGSRSLGRTALFPAAGSCGGALGHETSSVGGVPHRAVAIAQDPAPSQSHVSGRTVAGVGCRRPALCQDPEIFVRVNYRRYIRIYYK